MVNENVEFLDFAYQKIIESVQEHMQISQSNLMLNKFIRQASEILAEFYKISDKIKWLGKTVPLNKASFNFVYFLRGIRDRIYVKTLAYNNYKQFEKDIKTLHLFSDAVRQKLRMEVDKYKTIFPEQYDEEVESMLYNNELYYTCFVTNVNEMQSVCRKVF